MASNFRSQHQPLPHQVQKVHVKSFARVQVCEILVILHIHFALKLPHMCAHQNSIWKQAKDGLISESFLIWLTCPEMDGNLSLSIFSLGGISDEPEPEFSSSSRAGALQFPS